jgi:hypothetical protein
MKTEEDHAEGKSISETLNRAKVKTRDALPKLSFLYLNSLKYHLISENLHYQVYSLPVLRYFFILISE